MNEHARKAKVKVLVDPDPPHAEWPTECRFGKDKVLPQVFDLKQKTATKTF